MGNNTKKAIAIIAGFFIVVLFMFRDSGQTGKMLFGNDTITIYMAFGVFAQKMMSIYHSLPAWLPDIYLGMPMIGSSSLLFFYPTDFLFILLGLPLQYMYVPDLVIHMFLAALGMYLFLRKLKLSQPAALFGASAIMIAGYFLSYVYAGHWNNIKAGALIPLAFYFARCALEDRKLLHYLNTAAMLALMMLATGMQIMAYTFLAIIFYAAYHIIFIEKEKAQKIKSTLYLGACAVFILLFSAPQFIPSMQYTNYSWRGDVSYSDFISWSFHPAESITFLLPQFFGLFSNTYWGYMSFTLTTYYFGVLPFLLLFFLAVPGKHKKQIVFFSIASALFLLFAFGGYTFIYKLFYYIPVFKQFRNPSRFIYLVTFFVITLASIGLDNLFEGNEEKKKTKTLALLAGGTGIFLALFSLSLASGGIDSLLASLYTGIKKTAMPAGVMTATKEMIRHDLISFFFVSLFSLAVLFLAVKKKIKSAFVAAFALAVINFADVYRIDSKFLTFEDYSRFVPANNALKQALASDREPFRTANFDQLYGPNRNIYYGIDNLGGMHGLMPASYKQMENARIFNNINVNRAYNIKYYLSSDEIKVPGFEKFAGIGGVSVYMDAFAKNRVYFSNRIVRTQGGKAALDYMALQNFNPDEVVTGPEFPDAVFQPGAGSAVIKKYGPGRVNAVVSSAAGGIAVFSEGYYAQWKAKIDNKPAKIYCVNFASMGIMVPPGEHTVELYYSKAGVYIGLLLLAAALLFYAVVFARGRKPGK